MLKKTLISGGLLLITTTALAETSVDLYGSIRSQLESVHVDQAKAGENKSYSGIRDAYTRFGIKASHLLKNGTTLNAKIEIPFNTQRLSMEDPSFFEGFYKDNRDPRLYQIGASGDWGSVTIGKQWLAYYNHIAYPVDYFSSFYSGFATHATVRREAMTYSSPSMNGFNATLSMVDMTDGNNTSYLDTNQYALSYSNSGFNVSLAYQDSITGSADILGASLSFTTGPWRFATKLEQLNSPSGTTNPDPRIYNLYASYQLNNYTFKAHYAKGDESADGSSFFQGNSYHLGVDYQYTKSFKVFLEYFFEDHGYAIYTPNTETFDVLAGYHTQTGGSVFTIGARYDF